MKYFLVVMLLGNPTVTTWTEMPSLEVCETQKSQAFKKAVDKDQSVLIKRTLRILL